MLRAPARLLAELDKHGISLKEVTDELVKDGVQQFADAFDKLFAAIAKQRPHAARGRTCDAWRSRRVRRR